METMYTCLPVSLFTSPHQILSLFDSHVNESNMRLGVSRISGIMPVISLISTNHYPLTTTH